MTDTTERDQIMEALQTFIAQRGGIEPGNYSDYASYRQEQRSVTRDRHHVEKLLGAIKWRTSIGADQLKAAMKRAFSGRL
jgi:phenylalanyl-tRNA synthetase beta subunit